MGYPTWQAKTDMQVARKSTRLYGARTVHAWPHTEFQALQEDAKLHSALCAWRLRMADMGLLPRSAEEDDGEYEAAVDRHAAITREFVKACGWVRTHEQDDFPESWTEVAS